jgi:hypothetical protein
VADEPPLVGLFIDLLTHDPRGFTFDTASDENEVA